MVLFPLDGEVGVEVAEGQLAGLAGGNDSQLVSGLPLGIHGTSFRFFDGSFSLWEVGRANATRRAVSELELGKPRAVVQECEDWCAVG